MKKLMVTLMAVVLAFGLVACGGHDSPSDKVKQDIDAFKAEITQDDLMDGEDFGIDEESAKALVEKMQDFDYEIKDEKVNGDEAEVTVTIKAYPFGEAFSDAISELFAAALGGADEEELTKQFVEKLTSPTEKSYEKDVVIKCKKTDDGWESDIYTDEFKNAVTGGLMDAVNDLDNLIDAETTEE